MDFDTLVATMDDTLVGAFQKTEPGGGPVVQLTIHPRDGSGDDTVSCIVKNPQLEEDYVPGLQPGTRMLMLFIPASAGVVALMGDRATYGGAEYDVVQSDADRCGGVHIRLRGHT